jgi:hypothetical protein
LNQSFSEKFYFTKLSEKFIEYNIKELFNAYLSFNFDNYQISNNFKKFTIERKLNPRFEGSSPAFFFYKKNFHENSLKLLLSHYYKIFESDKCNDYSIKNLVLVIIIHQLLFLINLDLMYI